MEFDLATFATFFAVGFAAQLVDGALGMAYGVISTTVLLALGVPPSNASASVHAAKVFTGAASAISHIVHKNIDWRLLVHLSIAGVIGGVAGTYLLTGIEGKVVKPYVIGWLFLMGLVILYRAWKQVRPRMYFWNHPAPVGLFGGFFDAIGGGGWGPVVTSTLIGSGRNARHAIGTTNSAEFFVAVAVSVAFIAALLTGRWDEADGLQEHVWAVVGLIVGGFVAAPVAGWMTKVLPLRLLTWFVGFLVVALALWQAAQHFGLF
jgi:uncharacterized protein